MKADEFDQLFDSGESVIGELDFTTFKKPNNEPRRINVDFPAWMIESLDREASHMGVSRQAVIKMWIGEKLGKSA